MPHLTFGDNSVVVAGVGDHDRRRLEDFTQVSLDDSTCFNE